MIRRLLLVVLAAMLFGAVATSPAVAAKSGKSQKSGEKGACPKDDREPPNCGKGKGGEDKGGKGNNGYWSRHPSCRDKKDNDGDGKRDRADSECRDRNDGIEDGKDGTEEPPPPPPEGNCASADLILLTEDAKIVCVYYPPNGALVEEECPDAIIAESGPSPLDGGICVFLPPADSRRK